MELLPKSSKEFDKKSYWDEFFRKRGEKAFEWYGEFDALKPLLTKYIRLSDNVLVVGCGNSNLSADLNNYGVNSITNIDISENVIENMGKTSPKNMKWLTMDVRQMSFKNDEFSIVLDKGTLDAILKDGSQDALNSATKMIEEIDRVLSPSGRFICVSLLQEHIAQFLLDAANKFGWCFRIHRCVEAERRSIHSQGSGVVFPVFVVVCMKLSRKGPVSMGQIMEIAAGEDINKMKRASNRDVILQEVAAVQQYAFVRYHLSKRNVSDEQIRVDLYSTVMDKPRYVLYVIDTGTNTNGQFAIFIVPHGRETEWLFQSMQGQRQLGDSAGFRRLVVVHLSRDHSYENMDQVKAELSAKVMELAPRNFKTKTQVPFLTVGPDLGKRCIIHKGLSRYSGEFFVEDVTVHEEGTFRRLVFANNPNVIQSEVKLTRGRRKGKGEAEWTVDYNYLSCEHHVCMVASLAFVDPEISSKKILVVGLGGGALPMYIHHHLSNVFIEALEIDPELVSMAGSCFEFQNDDRMKVTVIDGLQFIEDAQPKTDARFDIVMIDADSKDVSMGMSCPPAAFVETETLRNIKNILTKQGILVLNLVCRDTALRAQVLSCIASVFPSVFTRSITDEVNVVVYGFQDVLKYIPSWSGKELRDLTGKLQLKSATDDGTACVRSLTKLLPGIQKHQL